MFLYGMNLMSSGLQKAAGDRLRGFLSAMTSNPLKGVMTGLGITTVIQSSSATTVMVVVEAQHMCMQMRGIEKQNSITTTSDFTGAFNQAKTREEFMNLIRG